MRAPPVLLLPLLLVVGSRAQDGEAQCARPDMCQDTFAATGPFGTEATTLRFRRKSSYKNGMGVTSSLVTYPVDSRCAENLHTYTGGGIAQIACRRFNNGTVTELAGASDRLRFPVVSYGHGAGAPVEVYESTYRHLASHGIIVISTKNPSTNPGAIGDDLVYQLLRLVDLNDDPKSIFYQRVDTRNFASMGHSMGGGAAMNAAVQAGCAPGNTYKYCIKTALGDHPAPWSNAVRLSVPAFFTSGNTDPLTPPASVRGLMYAPSRFPKAFATLRGGHLEPVDFVGFRRWAAWQTAWFSLYLKGDTAASWLIWGDGPGTLKGDPRMVTTLLDPQATLSLDRESARLAPGHSIRITGNLFSNVPASTRYRLWTFAKQDEQAVSAAQLGVAVSPRWTDMLDQPYSDDIRIEAMDGGGGNFRGRRRRLQLLQRARDALQQRRGGGTGAEGVQAPVTAKAAIPTGEQIEVVVTLGAGASASVGALDVVVGATNGHDGGSTAFATLRIEVVDAARSEGVAYALTPQLGAAARLGDSLRIESEPLAQAVPTDPTAPSSPDPTARYVQPSTAPPPAARYVQPSTAPPPAARYVQPSTAPPRAPPPAALAKSAVDPTASTSEWLASGSPAAPAPPSMCMCPCP